MGVLLLIILLVVVIPLAEGVLLAFLLREVYNKHPLPLGGTIGKREPPKPKVHIIEDAVEEMDAEEVSGIDSQIEDPPDEAGEPDEAADEPPQAEPSPKKDAEDVPITDPDGLPVNDVLAEMMAEIEAAIPGDLERTIEEASQSSAALLPEMQALEDEEDAKYDEDMQALADSLPEEKLDLAAEFDGFDDAAEGGDAISSLAKDVLGEDFDFDSLTKQSTEQPESESSAEKADSEEVENSGEPNYADLPDIPNVSDDLPDTMPDLSDSASEPFDFSGDLPDSIPDLPDAESEALVSEDLPEIAASLLDETAEQPEMIAEQSAEPNYPELPELEILEDESGTVQVSSPFISSAIPELAGLSTPQTIVPTFSSNWIQESASVLEPFEGDVSQFCYTEESRPMFVRRK